MVCVMNLFYDHDEKAYIEAAYRGGRFVDAKTGRQIILQEGARVRIAAPIWSMPSKEEKEQHKEVKRELFLKSGNELEFSFQYDGATHIFKVVLREDLFLARKGNQHSKLSFCRCVVFKPDSVSQKDFEADSLNQAFMKASIKYRSGNRSHTCNVFKTFYYRGRELESIRPF